MRILLATLMVLFALPVMAKEPGCEGAYDLHMKACALAVATTEGKDLDTPARQPEFKFAEKVCTDAANAAEDACLDGSAKRTYEPKNPKLICQSYSYWVYDTIGAARSNLVKEKPDSPAGIVERSKQWQFIAKDAITNACEENQGKEL